MAGNQKMATAGAIPRTSVLAAASLFFGILAWLLVPVLGILFAVVSIPVVDSAIDSVPGALFAVGLGHLALRRIRRAAGWFNGSDLALAGLTLGYAKAGAMLVVFVMAVSHSGRGGTHGGWDVRNQINTYKMALQSYCLDNGNFPTTQQGLQALISPPASDPVPKNWHGPYLDPPDIKPDLWGRPYIYVCPPQQNPDPEGFDLSSVGPDGHPSTDDDIVSWR